jgi:polysaccharide biosynthesis/export protein
MKTVYLIVLALLLAGGQATGQNLPQHVAGAHITRAELQQLLARYEEAASVGSGSTREQARVEAMLIRQRLDQGDMRAGDRVLLVVEGQPQLSETFNVVAPRKLVLPEIGDVPLDGILRAELQQHLTEHIGRFIRDPVVRAQPLIRLEIMGAVGQPGYYAVPADVLVSDAIMLAGGPAGNADVGQLRIQRGRDVMWQGERMRTALMEGRTLDQLSVQAGDGIFVPTRRGRAVVFREVLMVLSGVGTLVWAFRRIGVL